MQILGGDELGKASSTVCERRFPRGKVKTRSREKNLWVKSRIQGRIRVIPYISKVEIEVP